MVRDIHVRYQHAVVFINYLIIDHSLQSKFCTFPMCSEVGSSTVPFPMVCGQFRPKYRKRFESCLFLSGHLKVIIAISQCQFRLAIYYSHRWFRSSKLIHLIDEEVEEEGIIQHHQAQPGTPMSTASPRESLIVGLYVVMGTRVSPLWSSFVSIVEFIGEFGVFFVWKLRKKSFYNLSITC